MTRQKRFLISLGVYLSLCLTVNFFPNFGPPQFRYTGSDPIVHVWNLGWPLATAIYDLKNGLNIGPLFYILISSQLLFFIMASAMLFLDVRFLKRNDLPSS